MSKKYMRIYCNGEKIRSTGCSNKDIYKILNEFGCYDYIKLLNEFCFGTDVVDFVEFDIKYMYHVIGTMLIPYNTSVNVDLAKKIKNLILYLDSQKITHRHCIIKDEYRFEFSVEIVKKHGKEKEVIDKFNLPIGLKIQCIEGKKYFEFFTNIDFLNFQRCPWDKYKLIEHGEINHVNQIAKIAKRYGKELKYYV